jgi:hypothetical protein
MGMNSIPSWGAVICLMTNGLVWSARVFSGVGVVVMGIVGVTTLHSQGSGDPELP